MASNSTGSESGSLRWICLILGLVLFIASGCDIERPQTPQFETTLNIPFGVQTYSGLDMAAKLEAVEGDSTTAGPLWIRFSADLEPVTLADGLWCDVPSEDLRAAFDQIDFAPPAIDPLSVDLGDCALIPPDGAETVLDSFTIPPVTRDLGSFDTFREMHIAQGVLRLTIENGFPVPLGGPLEEGRALTVALTDLSGSEANEFAACSIDDPIAPGDTRVVDLDLSGATIGNRLAMTFSAWSAGSGGDSVWVHPGDRVTFSLEFTNCEIDQLSGPLDAFTLSGGASVDFSDDLTIREAVIERGRLVWRLRSRLPVPALVTVRVVNAFRGAEPLVITQSIPADGDSRIELDLTDVTIRGENLRALACEADVVTEESAEERTISIDQDVVATLEPARLVFGSLHGVLAEREIPVDPTPVDADFPEEAEGITFTAAEAVVTIRNTTGAAMRARLSVHGAADGDSASAGFEIDVPPGTESVPGEARAVLNERNSSILAVANLKPHSVWIDGCVTIGDGVTEILLRADDSIGGACTVEVPLRMILDSMRLEGDAFEIEMDRSTREQIAEDLESLTFDATIENHFPAGVQVRFHFASSEEELFVNDAIVIDADAIPSAPVDADLGRVLESGFHDWEATFDGHVLGFLAEPKVFGGIEVTLAGNGEVPCELWTTDYVTIRGMLSFRCRVHE